MSENYFELDDDLDALKEHLKQLKLEEKNFKERMKKLGFYVTAQEHISDADYLEACAQYGAGTEYLLHLVKRITTVKGNIKYFESQINARNILLRRNKHE